MPHNIFLLIYKLHVVLKNYYLANKSMQDTLNEVFKLKKIQTSPLNWVD